MNSSHHFWYKTVFQIVIAAILIFVLVTVIAMFTYTGGTYDNPGNAGYSFFTNFFSDLGRTVSHSGKPNTTSMFLFTSALTITGAGLLLFFVAFTQFFKQPLWMRVLTILGSLFGIGAAVCFIGVAFTPSDIQIDAHVNFVTWAFELFPVAVLFYIFPLLRHADYPRIYAVNFIAFAVLLILYILLFFFGPDQDTPEGLLIYATGQKIIVYASILSIGFQSYGALQYEQIESTKSS